MIFDGKSVHHISDDEIENVVNQHISERQHLEFKITVNHKDDNEKLEILRDIASLANGGGGYIIVGIRDDGKGRAQKFEPGLVGDVERIKKAIVAICQDFISERIEGLEVVSRKINDNPLVIMRIPASDRVPHMVTLMNRTDFYTRYHDGKREMTIGEIREFFNKDYFGQRLLILEMAFNNLTRKLIQKDYEDKLIVDSDSSPQLLFIKDGELLSQTAFRRFEKESDASPYFWISITPKHPNTELIKLNSEEIKKILRNPPGSRPNGWNMDNSYSSIKLFAEGLQIGEKKFRHLELFQNGHMEFKTPLDTHFCWRQSEQEFKQRPRLYPYPVTEYPTTFLRLYKVLQNKLGIKDSFFINLYYRNLQGYIILPYKPGTFGFDYPITEDNIFDKKHFIISKYELDSDFLPDKVAYQLVKIFYAAFGLFEETIPFYNREKEVFEFDVQ